MKVYIKIKVYKFVTFEIYLQYIEKKILFFFIVMCTLMFVKPKWHYLILHVYRCPREKNGQFCTIPKSLRAGIKIRVRPRRL